MDKGSQASPPREAASTSTLRHLWRQTGEDGLVRCFLMDGDVEVREVAAGLNFSRSSWMRDPERYIAAEALELISVPLFPAEVPARLAEIPGQQLVVYRDAVHQYDVVVRAGSALEEAQHRVTRAAAGRLSSREAAALLAELTHDYKSDAHEQILSAFIAGDLEFRNVNGSHRADPSRLNGTWGERKGAWYVLAEIVGEVSAYTTREYINRWLEKSGNPHRVEVAAPARWVTRKDLIAELRDAWDESTIESFLGEYSRTMDESFKAAKDGKLWNVEAVRACMRRAKGDSVRSTGLDLQRNSLPAIRHRIE